MRCPRGTPQRAPRARHAARSPAMPHREQLVLVGAIARTALGKIQRDRLGGRVPADGIRGSTARTLRWRMHPAQSRCTVGKVVEHPEGQRRCEDRAMRGLHPCVEPGRQHPAPASGGAPVQRARRRGGPWRWDDDCGGRRRPQPRPEATTPAAVHRRGRPRSRALRPRAWRPPGARRQERLRAAAWTEGFEPGPLSRAERRRLACTAGRPARSPAAPRRAPTDWLRTGPRCRDGGVRGRRRRSRSRIVAGRIGRRPGGSRGTRRRGGHSGRANPSPRAAGAGRRPRRP